jgi:hypothetical protein
LRESKPSTKISNFMALICSVINSETSSIHEAVDQQSWRNVSMQDDVCDIVPESEAEPVPGGSLGNTFFAKREC